MSIGSTLKELDKVQATRRKAVWEAYEKRMKCARAKLDRAKRELRAAEAEFAKAHDAADQEHHRGMEAVQAWAQDARRAILGKREVSKPAEIASTVRKTKMHGVPVSLPRLSCLEATA